MPISPLGVIDLSIVTDRLIRLLEDCRDNSPLWNPNNLPVNPAPPYTINVTGAAPDTTRSGSDCELSLFLFHVTQDKYQTNSPVTGPRVPPTPYQPLSLDLYYLLTAFAGNDYVHEQQAMSIAMRCFHENPIVRATVLFGGGPVQEEFSLTMEVQSADEISRLWQATTTSIRLSAVYKVSAVFLPPEAPERPLAPKPTRVLLGAEPTSLPFAETGQVTGTLRAVTYSFPSGSPPAAKQATFDLSPATAAAGQRLLLLGGGLNQPTSSRVYLLAPGGVEHEVTPWKAPDPAPPGSVLQTAARITLDLPATVGAPPANTPEAGLYQLRVGSDVAQGDAQTVRSNGTPFSIAARISPPPGLPVLAPVAGLYTFNGAGFVPGQTEMFLDTVELASTGGAPAAGQFNVNPTGTTIAFRVPAILTAGRFAVRVRVNQVECDPSWWVILP